MSRATVWTVRARNKFLTLLRETGNVSFAARAIGRARSRAYALRAEDSGFAAAWSDAVDEAIDRLEREAWRRAVEGLEEPVFYQGQVCGVVRRYSDRMLEMLLKAHRPEKYCERHALEHSGGMMLRHEDWLDKLASASPEDGPGA